MKLLIGFLIFFITTITIASDLKPKPMLLCNNKSVWGRVEKLILVDKNLEIDAKVDTGAAMASLSATDISFFKSDNKTWVQFAVYRPNTQEKIIFTKLLVRTIHILKRKEEGTNKNSRSQFAQNNYSIRPVIILPICIGNREKNIYVNLVDRRNFRYPMLLGREILKQFKVVVDVAQDHIVQSRCLQDKAISARSEIF